MTCPICGCKQIESKEAEVFEHNGNVLTVVGIPCFKCSNCDEITYTASVAIQLENIDSWWKTAGQRFAFIDFPDVA